MPFRDQGLEFKRLFNYGRISLEINGHQGLSSI